MHASIRLRLLIGLSVVDSYAAFVARAHDGDNIEQFMAQGNHPNRAGHEIVADALSKLMKAR